VTLKPTISQEESDRRTSAVGSANASMRLEGMGEMPPDIETLDQEFISGQIDVDEYGRIVRGWYGLK
jgi:Antitoxin VbhA